MDYESRRLFSEQQNQLGKLGEKLQQTLDGVGVEPSSSQVDQVVAELSETMSMASEVSTEHQLLRSINYPSLKARHAKISITYQETFEWIFKPKSRTSVDKCSEIKLLDWLKSQTGVFWVSGSPGSGKSTLMKYLCDHTATEEALKEWAKDKQLIIAKFFFWNAGNSLQKSYEGLLRSLLYEILRRCPNLIQSVCASRWQMIERNQMIHDWDILELSQMFEKLVQQESMSLRFCFFIDGLDEFDGDPYEIVQIFNSLSKSSHMKMCLSSRPWDIFEDAYGQDLDRKLYLQDLTRGDIDLYVRNNLEPHRALVDLTPEDKAQYQTVIEEIVDKSKGVFLWVVLVVRSLYDGLTNGDTISGLEDRLRSLPADLEKFFKHIMDQVDKKYQSDMARTFQEALQADEPLTLITHSYLDEPDPDFAIKLSIATIGQSKINSRCSMMRRRINARCKGLMEIGFDPSAAYFSAHRVEFLHRTVRDFLLTREMQIILDRYMENSVNIHRSLCRAYLALAKTMPEEDPLRTLVNNVLEHSHKAELATGVSDRRVLDELERTSISWNRISMANGLNGNIFQDEPLFNLALNKGLHIYVREKLDEQTPAQARNARLLLGRGALPSRGSEETSAAWAFWLLGIAADYHAAEHFDLRLKTLDMLVREGADPNRRHLEGTIVDVFLEWLHSVRKEYKTDLETTYLFNIVATLIDHGATPNLCSFQGRTRMLKSPEIPLEETFDQFPCEIAASLLKKTQPNVRPRGSQQPKVKHKFRFWLRQ